MQQAIARRFNLACTGAVLCIGIAIGFALASLRGVAEPRATSVVPAGEQHSVAGSRQATREQIDPENIRVDKLGEVPAEETREVVVSLTADERKVAAQKFNSYLGIRRLSPASELSTKLGRRSMRLMR